MSYRLKEIYYTLQGEGAQTGRPAVFCRFTGCNLWTGREEDRATAVCQFCDTDFVGMDGPGGGEFETSKKLAKAIESAWNSSAQSIGKRFVVFTGGEPLLQLDEPVLDELHRINFEVAVETNGTVPAPDGIDWICMSPKAGTDLVVTSGNELKLVFPQERAEPDLFAQLKFDHFFLQPMDGPNQKKNTDEAVRYCLVNPQWRLSLQTHKLIGLP